MSDLPPGWEWATLGEVAGYLNGRGFKKSEWSKQGRPIIRIQNLTGSGSEYNYYNGELEDRHVVRRGDLLVAWAATLGVHVWDKEHEGALNQHIFKVVPWIDKNYLRYALEHALVELREKTHGSGMVHITKSKFEKTSIPVPPLDEQRRIVDALDDHFSRINAADRTLRESRVRLVSLEKRYIDHIFGVVASEQCWPVTSVEGLAAEMPRAITDGPFGSNLASRHYTTSGALVVRLQNIGDGHFRSAEAFVGLEHYETLKSHNVQEGDVVIASLGDDLPRAAEVPALGAPAIVKADCIRVRLRPGVEPAWVELCCRAGVTKRWARSQLHGVGRQRLGMKGIRAIPVPLPEEDVRHQVLAEVRELFDYTSRVKSSLSLATKKSQALKTRLLNEALHGLLVDQDSSDEPASELLSRIARRHGAKKVGPARGANRKGPVL